MSHFLSLFVLLALLSAVCCTPLKWAHPSQNLTTRWKSCDKGSTTVTSLQVSGCEDQLVCPLIKGQTSKISITFVSDRLIRAAQMKVYGVIAHMDIPFSLDNPDACKDSGIQCPLAQASTYTYQSHIFVKESYPSLRLVIKWLLEDETGKQEFCVMFPAVLTPPSHLH